jgi:hypothetical protein
MTVFKSEKRNIGPEGTTQKVVVVTLLCGLVLAVVGGVVAAYFANQADARWNREGYAKAYVEAGAAMAKRVGIKNVKPEDVARLARSLMWEPRNVPARSRSDQRIANVFGLIGFFSLLAFVGCGAYYLWVKRREIAGYFKRKRLFEAGR